MTALVSELVGILNSFDKKKRFSTENFCFIVLICEMECNKADCCLETMARQLSQLGEPAMYLVYIYVISSELKLDFYEISLLMK